MPTLREVIAEVEEKKIAIGHFNVSTIDGVWAVFRAARDLRLPVLIGVSEGERDFFGVRQIAAVIQSIREDFLAAGGPQIFLNADHSYSVERAVEAAAAGFEALIFDGSKLPFEENVRQTKQAVVLAREKRPAIVTEGELGYIGTSSKLLEEIPAEVNLNAAGLTEPEQAAEFVRQTGVDLLAPAVGNLHGMLKTGSNPALDIDRIKAIRQAAGVPLVLHGASGVSDGDIKSAIAAGISIIHINTELRVAYRSGLKLSLQDNLDEVAPYKILKPAAIAMQKVVEKKLRLFNNL